MTQKSNRGPMLGLLAMFGALASGELPKFKIGVARRADRPARISDWLIARAKAKRARRAVKAGASAYARGNA